MQNKENWYRQLGEYRMVNGNKIRGVIGATMHLIRICGKNIIVDCGIGFEKSGEFQTPFVPDNSWLIGTRIDLILLTHKHLDHCGAIPSLVWYHPEALVMMSDKCFKGARISLEDSLKIWQSDAKRVRWNGFPVPRPVFSEQMLDAFYDNPNLIIFDPPYWLNKQDALREDQWLGWEIGFYDSGHDVGAVSVYIIGPDCRPFYLTGDIASHDQENSHGVLLPPDDFLDDFFDHPGLTMITEATNGARRMEQSREQLDKNMDELLKSVKTRGGIALFLVFAGTKAGNMLVKLNNLGHRVVIDGLARQHVRVEVPDIEQRIKNGRVVLIEENNNELAFKQRSEYATGAHGFVPIVVPSATLDHGFAASFYAPRILPDEKNVAIFPGHIFEDSTAKQLFKIKRGQALNIDQWINGKIEPARVKVRCDVSHFDYSSHDFQDGLVERPRLVKPETLIIHHSPGEDSFNALADYVRMLPNPPRNIRWGLNGETIYI